MLTDSPLEPLAASIVDSALKVHRALGPGLLESVYEKCFAYELRLRGIDVRCGVGVPIMYEGNLIDAELRMDMLVADSIIIENKSVESLHPVHHAQILTYLKLADLHLGFLINWNVPLLKQGLKRVVRGL